MNEELPFNPVVDDATTHQAADGAIPSGLSLSRNPVQAASMLYKIKFPRCPSEHSRLSRWQYNLEGLLDVQGLSFGIVKPETRTDEWWEARPADDRFQRVESNGERVLSDTAIRLELAASLIVHGLLTEELRQELVLEHRPSLWRIWEVITDAVNKAGARITSRAHQELHQLPKLSTDFVKKDFDNVIQIVYKNCALLAEYNQPQNPVHVQASLMMALPSDVSGQAKSNLTNLAAAKGLEGTHRLSLTDVVNNLLSVFQFRPHWEESRGNFHTRRAVTNQEFRRRNGHAVNSFTDKTRNDRNHSRDQRGHSGHRPRQPRRRSPEEQTATGP
jgi:hypothetical protein